MKKKAEKKKEKEPRSFIDFVLQVIDELNAEDRFSTPHVHFCTTVRST